MNREQPEMKLVITGGGTGGHIYPGLAVARELKTRRGDHTILFVGGEGGMEKDIVPREGFAFTPLKVTGLKGKTPVQKAVSLFHLVGAVARSYILIKEERPDVVLGVGGYASGPISLAAVAARRPLALAEQNAAPGMTNRWLGRFAKTVFVTWAGSENMFPGGRGKLVGNPVIPAFFNARRKTVDNLLNILVIGGSQGSATLNRAMAEAAPSLDEVADRISIVHQTGRADLEMMKTIYKNARFKWEAESYFYDMPQRIADADLVFSRAGAGAVAEICAVGRAAVYVPYPHAADDHQTKNAMSIVKSDAAIMMDDSAVNGKTAAGTIKRFIDSKQRLKDMGRRAKRLAKPDAAARIVDELLALAGEAA